MKAKDGFRRVERDLFEALERLRGGSPKNPTLIRRTQRGTLKINVSTVALEAGRSRTLISHDRCAYPNVRAAVLSERAEPELSTSLVEINRRLRVQCEELRRDVRVARESMAAMVLRMDEVVRDAERRVAIANRRATDPTAGTVSGKRGKVVDLR